MNNSHVNCGASELRDYDETRGCLSLPVLHLFSAKRSDLSFGAVLEGLMFEKLQ